MMNQGEAQRRIRQLNDAHEQDHDGGYALVEALRRTHDELDPAGRAEFTQALAAFVRAEDPELWAVAIEALVKVNAVQDVASLADDVGRRDRADSWKDHVVLGLIRLEQAQFHDVIVGHLRASLENPRMLTVPIIAALCRIDRSICLEIAAAYFTNAHRKGRKREVEGFIPAFVRNFVSVDDHLLPELAADVAARDPSAGQWLARCLDDYLSKPWMLKELGSTRISQVRGAISQATHGAN